MKCPRCGAQTKALVLESREHDGCRYRRRACGACGHGFVSVESAPKGLTMPREVRNSYSRRGLKDPSAIQSEAPTAVDQAKHLQGVWR